ncbi:hypothetical protein WCU47_26135 (plasmid) [Klebsiella quasipneumoniae]|uniref:hypothetical protein n=1 Tax=Klebsiella pneumoniae complex TaxID=3390273 RepID=UPI000CF6D2E1|nr:MULTISPECIES: hypothetical protein [Klebsiella]HEJ7925911.1 hypothetical protein [Klebsiella michiganensis]EIW9027188.1 hypothetical protein [Klebsiella pneumoniae]EIY5371101.1 hypothetical protein [Klebsiella quasipneumoniae]EJZ8861902.1 hypothetical protein [Klebsiella pneumoniae]EKL1155111.1 hypothetical protein [Klebsiella pneumoniae]
MKVTEPGLNTLIDNLNTLICEDSLLTRKERDALETVPDEEIGTHLYWLSEKLGRTPFSVAFQIAAIRELQDGWEEQFREISDNIRLSGLSISEYLKQNGTDLNA